jgi:energy-coupling factor transporter ATP-binding protein EcfA2
LDRLVVGLRQFIQEEAEFVVAGRFSDADRHVTGTSLQLRSISLRNIRCFESIDLPLIHEGTVSALLTLILGDNAAGKSTLLRSIALGLASESEASALIKALPGSFVRRGADEGSIHLQLRDPEDDRELAITTRISKNSGPDERVRKETDPDPFPWEKIFACAYGTNRSRQATASHDAYSLHQAVLSLFDDDALLQNPEVVLLRQESPLRGELERRLLSILMLDDPDYQVASPRSGIEIQGPWGSHPLRTLSDGYRSTAQWVLDFLAWSLYAGRFGNGSDIGGILLVDELEQHLHPRWQRHLVQRLRQQFPKTQILASTHTPLVAAGAADVESARLFRLKEQAEGGPKVVDVDPDSLAGLRADQILASEAFGLPTTRSPGSEDDVDRYSELFGKEPRTADEEAEMERLRTSLDANLQTGETKAEREVEQALDQVLKERLVNADPELVDVEVRRQLHQLFAGDEVD